MVHGIVLVFVDVPIQRKPPGPLILSSSDHVALDTAMFIFIIQFTSGIMSTKNQGFISIVFPILKKDSTA